MALAEKGLETGGMKCSILAEGAERNVPRNGNFGRAILEIANKRLKSKKKKKKGKRELSTIWKRTLRIAES